MFLFSSLHINTIIEISADTNSVVELLFVFVLIDVKKYVIATTIGFDTVLDTALGLDDGFLFDCIGTVFDANVIVFGAIVIAAIEIKNNTTVIQIQSTNLNPNSNPNLNLNTNHTFGISK